MAIIVKHVTKFTVGNLYFLSDIEMSLLTNEPKHFDSGEGEIVAKLSYLLPLKLRHLRDKPFVYLGRADDIEQRDFVGRPFHKFICQNKLYFGSDEIEMLEWISK